MVEPITAVGLGAVGAYLGKDLLTKLLGPTADYLGEGLHDLVKTRAETLTRIVSSAAQKLGDKIEKPGAVPPKILKGIIADGSFATDEIEIEYFAGILAASRTPDGKNDRGVRALRTIQSLSSDQIRTHYIIYSCLLAKYYQNTVNINEATQASGLEMFLGSQEFLMEINVSNPKVESYSEDMIADTVSHCLFGVADESLISSNLMWGPKEHMKNEKNWVRGSGLVVAPSPSGFELFRLGLGESQSTTSSILMDSSIQKKIDGALVERMRPQIPPG